MRRDDFETDLLIIGAGIAGIATAERVSREAARRGRVARILVIDSAETIGGGASAGLQGWFHSGALYATLDGMESQNACTQSLDLLAEHYGPNSDFEHAASVNLSDIVSPESQHSVPTRAWFVDRLDFLIDCSDHPDARSWANNILSRISSSSPGSQSAGEIIKQNTTMVRTADRSMNTRTVLRDLADAATQRGTRFALGAESLGQRTGGIVEVRDRRTQATRTISARRVIVTNGHLLKDGPFQRQSPVSRRSGVIVSCTPAIEAPSTATVAFDTTENFSHLFHQTPGGSFSAMGDSTSLPENPDELECERVALGILRKAVQRFGSSALDDRLVVWHSCTKAEPGRVSGTIEPTFGPLVWPLDTAGQTLAMIPSKFSLFPLAADTMTNALGSEFFMSLDHSRGEPESVGPDPVVAPTRSELLLGLNVTHGDSDSGAPWIRFLHGRLTARSPANPTL